MISLSLIKMNDIEKERNHSNNRLKRLCDTVVQENWLGIIVDSTHSWKNWIYLVRFPISSIQTSFADKSEEKEHGEGVEGWWGERDLSSASPCFWQLVMIDVTRRVFPKSIATNCREGDSHEVAIGNLSIAGNFGSFRAQFPRRCSW